MASELLERVAVPMLEALDLSYAEVSENLLLIGMTSESAGESFNFALNEVENMSEPTIVVRVVDFVRFPKERRDFAAAMCNDFTRSFVGKFTVDSEGDVSFALECAMTDSAGPDDLKPTFGTAMVMFLTIYPVIMRMRWSDETMEEALEAVERDKQSAETDGGESGDSIMTNEQIRRLMGDDDGGDEESPQSA